MKKDKSPNQFKNILKKVNIVLINVFKVIKRLFRKFIRLIKDFGKKDFGKFNGRQVLSVIGVLIVLLFISSIFNTNVVNVDYPVVYKTNDKKLMLLNSDSKIGKEIKLSGEGLANSVMYANTTNRYLLFVKNDGLYLYDSKSKEQTTKLVANISDYYKFTKDDKYIVMKDDYNNLYVYDYDGEKELIESSIRGLEGLSNKNILYTKDGALYIKGLKASKDDKKKITDASYQARVTTNGKLVYYIDSSKNIYEYKVSSGKVTQIDSLVSQMYVSEETGNLYYLKNDGKNYTLYYYDGKKNVKLQDDVLSVVDYDADDNRILYLKKDGNYELYYQYKDKKAHLVDGKLDSNVISGYIYKDDAVYYMNSDNELYYAKINGAKLKRVIKVETKISSKLYVTNKGFVFVKDANDEQLGTLYITKGAQAKKIDKDVYVSKIKVSNDGNKFYYLKDFEGVSGDLYVSSGRKGKELVRDVYSYQYANDDLIYYIKNYNMTNYRGDLYRYDGKSKKIATDIDASIATMPNEFKLN